MNKALISIGTNEERKKNLTLCHRFLNNEFDNIHYSDTSVTKPYGATYKNDFLNQLAIIYTEKEKEEVAFLLKKAEKEIGRNAADKLKGIVKIDIDLVIWNDEVLKPADITRSYIKDLLPSLQKD